MNDFPEVKVTKNQAPYDYKANWVAGADYTYATVEVPESREFSKFVRTIIIRASDEFAVVVGAIDALPGFVAAKSLACKTVREALFVAEMLTAQFESEAKAILEQDHAAFFRSLRGESEPESAAKSD